MNFIYPIRIIDGLFLGDSATANDLEFMVTNKVLRVINCAAKQLPNHWESLGISYLSYQWMECEIQFIYDFPRTFLFIDEALQNGESVLIHSVKGLNRSIFVIATYIMKKFRWSLFKTLQFIHNIKKDFDLRQNVFSQLMLFEEWLKTQKQGAKSNGWEQVFSEDEMVHRNTYLNSQKQDNTQFEGKKQSSRQRKFCGKVRWARTLVQLWIPPYVAIHSNIINQRPATPQKSTIKQQKNILNSNQISRLQQIDIKIDSNLGQQGRKLTLSQLVNDQLQRKMENIDSQQPQSFRIQRIQPQPVLRPQTAPVKGIQGRRLLKQRSQRSPIRQQLRK